MEALDVLKKMIPTKLRNEVGIALFIVFLSFSYIAYLTTSSHEVAINGASGIEESDIVALENGEKSLKVDGNTPEFVKFEETPIGWIYEKIGNDALKVAISVFIDTLSLTPIFGHSGVQWFHCKDDVRYGSMKQNFDIVRNEFKEGHKSLVLDVRSYLDNRVKFQKFQITFGSGFAPVTLYVVFDELDYSFRPSEWIGFDDKNEIIGDSGYAVVNRGIHKKYQYQCAIKKRPPTWHYFNETKILTQLRQCPSVLDIYAYGVVDGRRPDHSRYKKKYNATAMIVSELMDGTARDAVDIIHNDFRNGLLEERDYHAFVDEISSDAVKTVIEGVIAMNKLNYAHVDIKSANMLFKKLDTPEMSKQGVSARYNFRFKLSDVESVLLLMEDDGTTLRTYDRDKKGRAYRPPEMVIKQFRPFDGRVDIYAIGVLAFELITERYPLQGTGENRLGSKSDEYFKKMERVRDLENCDDCFVNTTISDDAMDFIFKTMKFFPDHRISIHEALEHPWIQKYIPT